MPRKRKQTNPQAKSLARTRFILVVSLFALAVVLTSIVKELIRRHDVQSELSQLEQEIKVLESRNIELSSLLTYLRSTTYHEQEARLKLGLQGQGERVFIVPGTEAETVNGESVAVAASTSTVSLQQDNPSKWWKWLFLRDD